MGKVIAVGSGKGGTGKTTTTAAVSSCLAALGHKTLCLDFDFRLRNLYFALGLPDIDPGDFSGALSGKAIVAEACREHPMIPKLFYYSSDASHDLEELDISAVRPVFEGIRREFDYCVIDSPSAADHSFRLAHADADMSIIVTTGELPSMVDVQRAASVAIDSGVSDLRLLVNRCLPESNKWIGAAIDDAISAAGVQLIGLIPDDRVVFQASHENVPLILYSRRHAVYHFLDVARRVAGEDVPLRVQLVHPLEANRAPGPRRPPVSRRPLVPPPAPAKGADEKTSGQADAQSEKPASSLLKSTGEPELWAKSTLPPCDTAELFKLYVVKPGTFQSEETIRQRMWLHDILDDHNIPYHIEIGGFWPTRKKFVETQRIYVEKKHSKKAVTLLREWSDPSSLIAEAPVDEEAEVEVVDGVPQKTCASCGREIDFDYSKCPYCKASKWA